MSTSELVTILFTDLVGSTALTSEIGDEAADELRRNHFSDLRSAIASTGGTEVKTIGDAVMVSYSSAADALGGAVAMQRLIERRNRTSNGHSLEMRIGISAGDATFEDDDWFGTCVIEASRLCGVANGGQILISDLVRALAGSRSDADITAVGERELKGLPQPVPVCEVRWATMVDERAFPLPGFVDTSPTFPFAGRVSERETLTLAWKEAMAGARRVVMVSGEPGVGKTRLVTETVRATHQQGATVLWGRCDEELEVPYQPMIEALRHYVQSVPGETLSTELGPLGGELTRLIPDLAHLVAGLAEPVRTEAETERHRLFEAVADLFEAMTDSAPVVLVIDDLHWADKPSLLMLRHILRRSPHQRLLILATYRDTDLDRSHPLSDVLADLRREQGVERLDIVGLDGGEVAAFMEGAAGHELAESALELAAAVHKETEGNPFFIGEMLLHLAESGKIVQRDGRWESDFTLADVGIPEGVREVVGRRLSNLSDTANAALATAAVVGPEFDVAIVEAAGTVGGDDLLDALDEAAAASIIKEVPDVFGRYGFAHALVRSTLYEELGTNRRVRLHWRVGEAIEARHQHDLDLHLDGLAHHYTEGALAGDAMKAIEFGRRAAERALGDLAFEAAARHYDQSLATVELLAEPDPAVTFDLQLGLCSALEAASDERYRDVGFAAAATARAMNDADRVATAAATMTGPAPTRVGTLDEQLIELLESALDGIGEAASPMRARLLSSLAVELAWGPESIRRRELSGEAIALARTTGDPVALKAALLGGWSSIDMSVPYFDTVIDLNNEAQAHLQGDLVGAFYIERLQLGAATARGQRDAMNTHLATLLALAESTRQPRYIWMARNDQAMVTGLTGTIEQAETETLTNMQYGQDNGVPEDLVMGGVGSQLYYVRRAQGRIDELVPLIEDLVESQPGLPVWRVALAGSLAECDRADDAVEHIRKVTENDFANVPPDIQYAVTMCAVARLSRMIEVDEVDMRHAYERLLPFAGTFNWTGTSVTDANDLGLAVLSARLGNHEAADRHFQAAVDLCDRLGARSYLATTQLDWARMLAERDDPRAAALASQALELGQEMDMTGPYGVVVNATRLLDDLGAG